jgi:16S rRNA processing protein RimM
MDQDNNFLTVGRILRPHGIRGKIEILPLTDSPSRFKSGSTFLLEPPIDDRDSVTLTDIGKKKDRLTAKVEGVDDRNGAEALAGCELLIPVSEGEKPADSFWHHEIIGALVVTDEGVELGRVVEIIETGANDIYAVGEDRKFLIPALKEIILEIDLDKKLIKIKPLPGLLEL